MFNGITKAKYCCADFSVKQINPNYSVTSGNSNHYILKIFVVKLREIMDYNCMKRGSDVFTLNREFSHSYMKKTCKNYVDRS